MVVIDWLSVNYHGIYNGSKLFREKVLPYRAKMFDKVVELYNGPDLICTMAMHPPKGVLHVKLIQVKFANKLLYHPGLFDFIQMVESDLELKFVGFSRLDLAHDFNTFAFGLDPELFIKKVAGSKYIKKGIATLKFIAKNRSRLFFQYLKIGVEKSDLVGYLYNKTAELEEVKNKPYIREVWEKNSLNILEPVWRLEFSIKGNSWNIIDTESGENYSHTTKLLSNTDLLINIYTTCFDRLFTFYYNDGKKRKDRNRKLILFTEFKSAVLLEKWCETMDSDRSDRIMINKLLSIWDSLREAEKGKGMLFYNAAHKHARRTDLMNYFSKSESKYLDLTAKQKPLSDENQIY